MIDRLLSGFAFLGRSARRQALELSAGVSAAAFLISGRVSLRAAARAIDFDLLLVLFALLITVEILRESGYLERAVAGAVSRFRTTRSFAAMLIVTAGLFSCILTNDVTLFVIIPFTVIASRMSDFDVEDAVVLEVVSANLLGCLTPLGNPQNLFVYHQSGWLPGRFIATMAPFVAWSMVGLLFAIVLMGKSKPIVIAPVEMPVRKRSVALTGVVCLALVILEIARLSPAWMAAVAAAIAAIFVLKRRTLQIDFSIVPLFLFAFIIVEGVRTFDMRALMRADTYTSAIVLSQFISNVPATILLTPFADSRWRELLYGANAGGCGTIVASLANLLGWRIYVRESGRDPRFFWRLTIINFVFLVWVAAGGWVLLRFAS